MVQQLTMRDLNILITVCLNIGLSFSKGATLPCYEVQNGLCGRGQHVVFSGDSEYTCADCPQGTYLDFHSHSCETCKSHSHPRFKEIVIKQGRSTHDNVIVCKDGFFKLHSKSSRRRGGCQECSICQEGTVEVRSCGGGEDRLCCQPGKVAGREDGAPACVLPHFRFPRQLESLRKERSSSSGEDNSTVISGESTEGAATSQHGSSQSKDSSDPSHGYSRADFETEYRQSKVEFPIWARILCAGIAVGVFLFYLGVGIPCNACGSRDKLRALRHWAFSRSVEITVEPQPKEKPPVRPQISSEPV